MALNFGVNSLKTIQSEELENSFTCIALSRDASRIAAAGRSIFKIYSIENNEFVEQVNLRVGRSLNLSYSCNDIAWNQVDDNIIATAATNGMVVTWDLNKPSRSKQDVPYNVHERTVNRVCFNPSEHNLLLSGSLDGFMNIFDLRRKDSIFRFGRKSDSVKDVQFSPFQSTMFASAHENGHIQIWDYRNMSRCERTFPGHYGPVFSLDWHPEERYWLSSAGREFIEVWDLQHGQQGQSIYTIRTFTAVSQVRWRPSRKYQLASCSILLDFNVNVWDVRRPYIPFGMFDEHKNTVTGIVWRQKDPHCFYSCGRDCRLIQHVFKDAKRPADNANPVALDLGLDGQVAHAVSDRLIENRTPSTTTKVFPLFGGRKNDRTEQFTAVSSTLRVYQPNDQQLMSMEKFIVYAENYKLTGPMSEVCEHNARVAAEQGNYQVMQTWRIVSHLYGSPAAATQISTSSKSDGFRESDAEKGLGHKNSHSEPLISALHDDSTEDSSAIDEESEVEGHLQVIASGGDTLGQSDFFLGDGDRDEATFNFDFLTLGDLQPQEWTIPSEAIQIRKDIPHITSLPEANKDKHTVVKKAMPSNSKNSLNGISAAAMEANIKREILSAQPFSETLGCNPWPFGTLVRDMVHEFAERADTQTAVCLLIVLGDKLQPAVDEALQEQWFHSYIELLARLKLWPEAANVIKLSSLPAIRELSHASTTIFLGCSRCLKPLTRAGWLCDRCKDGGLRTCAICRLPVKGLYAWCQGCAHGGHVQHIQSWLSKHRECPAGCGHHCEYT